MDEIQQLVCNLWAPQQTFAHSALKALVLYSRESDRVYPYFDQFSDMLNASNSFLRMRGLTLIAENVRWDRDKKLDRILDAYLDHILDEKPIAARQCIQALHHILVARPDLAHSIRGALTEADFSVYADSMSPLLQKDAINILKQIDALH